jgi:solute carrier family 45 protein 1/2/4
MCRTAHSTTWVSELFLQGRSLADSDPALVEQAERIGSRAMFWHALVNLAAATILPLLVNQEPATPFDVPYRLRPDFDDSPSALARFKASLKPHLASLEPFLPTLPFQSLSLSLAWTFANALFSILLISTLLVREAVGASVIIGLTGLCWAVTAWVPFSLVRRLRASS